MKAYLITFILTLPLFPSVKTTSTTHPRILHQPFFPPTSDNPFFHEAPDQPQPPPPDAASPPIAPAKEKKSGEKLAVGISVGIVTLGMLSGLAFFIYKLKSKQQIESRKLVSGRHDNEDLPPARFPYVGTVDSSTAVTESINGSPYNKLNSLKTSDRYRPSPDLQPLPPLSKLPAPAMEEEEEIHDFYTPHGSTASTDEGYSVLGLNIKRIPRKVSSPNSKRTSPRSRLSVSSSPDLTSENPHPAISPIKTTSTSPAAKLIPKIIKPASSQ